MINTSLCSLLRITHPIVQAGMGGVAGSDLAIAVSEAGALGNIGVYRLSPSELRAKLQQVKKLTDKPIGVNFVPDVLSLSELEQGVAVALEENIRFFSFFSNVSKKLIREIHKYNALAFLQVGSKEQAEIAIELGADILIVQGWEAGGHLRGKTALLPLLSSISHRWTNIPLLASGGISTGQGLVSALAVGAHGAWIGTRFAAAIEADAHPDYQQRIVAATAKDTVVTNAFDQGWLNTPHRVLRNSITEALEPLPRRLIGFAQIEGRKVPIPLGSVAVPTKSVCGDIDSMAQYCGQGCELIDSVQPAAEIINRIIAEAEATINFLSHRIMNC